MKIVWWIDHLGLGGTQKVLLQLVRGVSSGVTHQAIVCLNDITDPILMEEIRSVGVEVRVIGKWKLATGIGLVSTYQWLKRNQFDVAVSFLFYADIVGTLLSWRVGIKNRISSQRASNLGYKMWQDWTLKMVLRQVGTVVINTVKVRSSVARYLPRKVTTVVIKNGVCLTHFKHYCDKDSVRQELGIPENALLIGSFSRLAPQKDVSTLIQAFKQCQQPNTYLLVVGTGQEESKLRKLVATLGLARRIYFLGQRHDVQRILRQSNVYAQTSTFEGMSNSLMEAMFAGCPVVASAVDGNLELIDHGLSGLLVKPKDPRQLSVAIDRLLSDPSQAATLAANAKARIEQEYSEETMVLNWRTLLGI